MQGSNLRVADPSFLRSLKCVQHRLDTVVIDLEIMRIAAMPTAVVEAPPWRS